MKAAALNDAACRVTRRTSRLATAALLTGGITLASGLVRLNAGEQLPAPPASGVAVTAADYALELEQLQTEKSRQFQRVQRQFEELSRRWRSGPMVSEAAASPSPGAPSKANTALPDAVPPSADDGHAPAQPPPYTVSSLYPALVEGEVDRRALADALLATGRVPEAERLLTDLLRTGEISAADPWTQYQLAACDRRQGRIPAACERYRQLVARGQSDWLTELARWWLTTLEDQERLVANRNRLQLIVEQLNAAADSEFEGGLSVDSAIPHP